MKILKKYYPFFIPITIFIFGLIRSHQISSYEVSISKSTMTGIFTFYAYSIVSISLFVSSLLIKLLSSIKSEKFNINVKILLITLIGSIGLSISIFILYFVH